MPKGDLLSCMPCRYIPLLPSGSFAKKHTDGGTSTKDGDVPPRRAKEIGADPVGLAAFGRVERKIITGRELWCSRYEI